MTWKTEWWKSLLQNNKEKRKKRNEDSLSDLWDNIKHTNIRIIGIPEEEEKEKGPEKIFEEIIVENFPNMGKEIVTQVREVQRVPYRINPKRTIPRHIVIKMAKIKAKERTLKAKRGKQQVTCKRTPIGYQLIFQWKFCRPERSGMIYLK